MKYLECLLTEPVGVVATSGQIVMRDDTLTTTFNYRRESGGLRTRHRAARTAVAMATAQPTR